MIFIFHVVVCRGYTISAVAHSLCSVDGKITCQDCGVPQGSTPRPTYSLEKSLVSIKAITIKSIPWYGIKKAFLLCRTDKHVCVLLFPCIIINQEILYYKEGQNVVYYRISLNCWKLYFIAAHRSRKDSHVNGTLVPCFLKTFVVYE